MYYTNTLSASRKPLTVIPENFSPSGILSDSSRFVHSFVLPMQKFKIQNQPNFSTSLICSLNKTPHFPSRYLVHFSSL